MGCSGMDRPDPAAEPHLIFDIENEDRRGFSVVFVYFVGGLHHGHFVMFVIY